MASSVGAHTTPYTFGNPGAVVNMAVDTLHDAISSPLERYTNNLAYNRDLHNANLQSQQFGKAEAEPAAPEKNSRSQRSLGRPKLRSRGVSKGQRQPFTTRNTTSTAKKSPAPPMIFSHAPTSLTTRPL